MRRGQDAGLERLDVEVQFVADSYYTELPASCQGLIGGGDEVLSIAATGLAQRVNSQNNHGACYPQLWTERTALAQHGCAGP